MSIVILGITSTQTPEKQTPAPALAIASHRGSRHDPSVHTCNFPSQRYHQVLLPPGQCYLASIVSVACIFNSASQFLSSHNCRYLIGSVVSLPMQELGPSEPTSHLCMPGA